MQYRPYFKAIEYSELEFGGNLDSQLAEVCAIQVLLVNLSVHQCFSS